MAVAPTIVLPVDVDKRSLVRFTDTMAGSLHEMAGHLEALAESFDKLSGSLAELEAARVGDFARSLGGDGGDADAAHR